MTGSRSAVDAPSDSACDYDIVIAGGGMVGASLALQLQRHSQSALKILVVEAFEVPAVKAQPVYSPSFDARSTALSYGSRIIFEQLGVWSQLAEHVAAIKTIHVSERGGFSSATMAAEEMNWPALGYVIENAWLGSVLLKQVREHAAISFACPASVEAVEPCCGSVLITLKEGTAERKLRAQLLVIADGAQSGLRQQLGIQAQVQDYQQSALVANVCFEKAHQSVAYERFTDEGPMALLPLPASEQGQPRAALVWTNSAEKIAALSQCDEQEFLAQLQQRFGHRLGAFTRVGERVSYPLKLVEAQEQVRSGVVVMGNAAHSLHPVAGQGFNLALRDCARLTDVLVAASPNTLGKIEVLQGYQQSQTLDQYKTIVFSDKVGAFFAHKSNALSILRHLGLAAMDVLPSFKESFVRHAAGQHQGAALGFVKSAVKKNIK